jgi:hypothetical protein
LEGAVTKSKQDRDRQTRRDYTAEHRPPDVAPSGARPDEDELVGESEYTTREAGERSAIRRVRGPGGPAVEEPLVSSHDMLGRRYLEGATESPGPEEIDPNLDPIEDLQIEDAEESSADVEAAFDPAADPISAEGETDYDDDLD